MSTPPASPRPLFAVVVPVKPPARGKSRLLGPGAGSTAGGVDPADAEAGDQLSDDQRRALARSFALDTVEAALGATAVGAVLVVTDDAAFSAELTALGGSAIPDGVSLDLNGTLRQAAAEAVRRWPDLLPVAMCADLPALRPADLDIALGEVAEHLDTGHAAYVADAEGIGTTLYAAALADFAPQFGTRSAAVHEARGARPVAAPVTTLRRDVDDVSDLREALALGVGPRTAATAAGLARPRGR